MKILQEATGSDRVVFRIVPSGRLDAVTVPTLEEFLQSELSAGHNYLILDLSEVSYLSSSGLRALLQARRQAQAAGGDLVLAAMSVRAQEIFEMIGFTNLFRVFDRVAEAVVALTQPAVNSKS
ncbi:MAG TPA: STAS domain-containing protein [Anaerolineae bacterium]|nr:STAS domain-containing protein [Anaerolineae bacterium]